MMLAVYRVHGVAVLCSCISIKFLYEHMSMRWVLEHQLLFVKALLFVIMDLTGEVRPSRRDYVLDYMNTDNAILTAIFKVHLGPLVALLISLALVSTPLHPVKTDNNFL